MVSGAYTGTSLSLSHPPQKQASPSCSPHQPTMEVHAVHTRDVGVGSGSEGSQPKRRKRSTVTKNAQARSNGGYGHYSAYAPQSGYGHHPIHGHYADYELGPVHGKGKKQAVHRTPKQDDKGPCLNPACRTTGEQSFVSSSFSLGIMYCPFVFLSFLACFLALVKVVRELLSTVVYVQHPLRRMPCFIGAAHTPLYNTPAHKLSRHQGMHAYLSCLLQCQSLRAFMLLWLPA